MDGAETGDAAAVTGTGRLREFIRGGLAVAATEELEPTGVGVTDLTDTAGGKNKVSGKVYGRCGALLFIEFDLRRLDPGSIPHSAGIWCFAISRRWRYFEYRIDLEFTSSMHRNTANLASFSWLAETPNRGLWV